MVEHIFTIFDGAFVLWGRITDFAPNKGEAPIADGVGAEASSSQSSGGSWDFGA